MIGTTFFDLKIQCRHSICRGGTACLTQRNRFSSWGPPDNREEPLWMLQRGVDPELGNMFAYSLKRKEDDDHVNNASNMCSCLW